MSMRNYQTTLAALCSTPAVNAGPPGAAAAADTASRRPPRPRSRCTVSAHALAESRSGLVWSRTALGR